MTTRSLSQMKTNKNKCFRKTIRRIGAGTVVETMSGGTLRGAKRSGPGSPWAQYINRSAPCLPARQVRVSWLLDVLGCFLVVCRVFVFCRMLDARGNLDLESPEELLTSSGTPRPRPGSNPSGPIAFWRFIFASFFVMCFCIVFSYIFDRFRPPFWHHVGVIFNVFCITFSSIDFSRICHQFFKDVYRLFEVFLLISKVLHLIGESLKNNCFYFTFA